MRVIVSFRHKGLERLYRDGSKKGLQAARIPRPMRIRSAPDVAQSCDDLLIPSFRTHPLKGDPAGHWSIWVNGNWRSNMLPGVPGATASTTSPDTGRPAVTHHRLPPGATRLRRPLPPTATGGDHGQDAGCDQDEECPTARHHADPAGEQH
jgi:toxin HigB-1